MSPEEREKLYDDTLEFLRFLNNPAKGPITTAFLKSGYISAQDKANYAQIEFAIVQLEYLRNQEKSAREQEAINKKQESINVSIKIATWVIAIATIVQIIIAIFK